MVGQLPSRGKSEPTPIWGKAPVVAGLPLDQDARRVFQIVPTIGYPVGSGTLELSAQIPVTGRNLPSGTGFGVGYRTG